MPFLCNVNAVSSNRKLYNCDSILPKSLHTGAKRIITNEHQSTAIHPDTVKESAYQLQYLYVGA